MGDKGRQKMVGKKVCMSLCVCVCAHCKWFHGKTSLQISVNLNVNRKQKYNNNCRWIILVAAAGAVVCWKPGQLRFWIANSKIFKRRFPGNSAVLSRFCCLLYGAKNSSSLLAFFTSYRSFAKLNGLLIYSFFVIAVLVSILLNVELRWNSFFPLLRVKSTLILLWLGMWMRLCLSRSIKCSI